MRALILPRLSSNARVLAKCPLAGVLQFPDSLGNCDDINVVEEGKHRFALTQLRVNGCKSRVLSDGVEGGHKRVALFAALRLLHLVALPASVLPHVRAVGSLELAHVRQAGSLPETSKHRVARHMIERPDCIDGQHRGTRVVATRRRRTSASVPARVLRPN